MVFRIGVAACLAVGLAACTEPNPHVVDSTSGGDGGSESTGAGDGASGIGTDEGSTGGGDGEGSGSTSDGGTGTSDGSSDGSTTGGALPCSGTCVEDAPTDWLGPIAVIEGAGATPGTCEADFGAQAFAGYEGLDPGQASCDCSCGAAQSVTCPGMVDVTYGDTSGSCGGTTIADVTASCTPIAPPINVSVPNRFWKTVPVSPSGGFCDETLTPAIDTPTWDGSLAGCNGEPAGGTCEDAGDVCMPTPASPFAEKLCIWQLGDHECPAGSYSDKTLVHDDFTDGRACEDCVCGEPVGTCTEPIARTHAQNTCLCITSSCDFGSTCTETALSQEVGGIELVTAPTVEAAECTPNDPQVTGEVTSDDPRTVCCTP